MLKHDVVVGKVKPPYSSRAGLDRAPSVVDDTDRCHPRTIGQLPHVLESADRTSIASSRALPVERGEVLVALDLATNLLDDSRPTIARRLGVDLLRLLG